MTPYILPCDYGPIKPPEDQLTELIDQWNDHVLHTYTKGGNVKPPERSTIITWLMAAWDKVHKAFVCRSFHSCCFLGTDAEIAFWRLKTPLHQRLWLLC